MVSIQFLVRPNGVTVLTFLIQKFFLSSNFSFSVLVGLVFIFRSCSITMNLQCLLNAYSQLLEYLHASMVFGFFMLSNIKLCFRLSNILNLANDTF